MTTPEKPDPALVDAADLKAVLEFCYRHGTLYLPGREEAWRAADRLAVAVGWRVPQPGGGDAA